MIDKRKTRSILTVMLEPTKNKGMNVLLRYEATAVAGRLLLESIEFSEGSPARFRAAVLEETPAAIRYERGAVEEFEKWRRAGVAVREIEEPDLSFEHFWEAYGYKVGAKARVKKKWERLGEVERLAALGGIMRYRRFAESKRIEMAYPETYLDQRRWENEY